MFALELGVPFPFQPVFDLTSQETGVYANNPAPKVPNLVDDAVPCTGPKTYRGEHW